MNNDAYERMRGKNDLELFYPPPMCFTKIENPHNLLCGGTLPGGKFSVHFSGELSFAAITRIIKMLEMIKADYATSPNTEIEGE